MKRLSTILLAASVLALASACSFDSKIRFNALLLDPLSSLEAASAGNVLQVRFTASLSPEDAAEMRRVNTAKASTLATLESAQVMTDRGDWIPLNIGNRQINLADPDLDILAVDAALPEGSYKRIKLVFADELTMASDTTAGELADCSSCQDVQRDIEELQREETEPVKDPNARAVVMLEKPFIMKKNRTVLLTLKADVNKWVTVDDEDGDVSFNPTAEVAAVDISGMQSPGKDIAVSFGQGQVRITGEKDTLRENAEFSAGMLTGQELSPYRELIKAPEGSTILAAVELKPSMDFHRPVLVGVRYDAAAIEGMEPEELHVGYLDEKTGVITEMPVHHVDTATSTIYFYTSHFSIFTIFKGMFRLEHPSGITARVNYSFLNYYLNTIFPIAKPGFIPLPEPVGSLSGSYSTNINMKLLQGAGGDKAWLTDIIARLTDIFGYCGINLKLKYTVAYYLRSFDLRKLVFDVSSPEEGIIQVSVRNGSPIELGTLRTLVSVKPVHPVLSCECEDDCPDRYRACKSRCRGNKVEKFFCKIDCAIRRDACKMRAFACSRMKMIDRQMDVITRPFFRWLNRNNGFEESYSSRWRHVAIEDFKVTMRFRVVAEPGKPLGVQLLDDGEIKPTLKLTISDVKDSGTAGGPLGLIIHTFADKSDLFNGPLNSALASSLKLRLPDEVQAQLTKTLAQVSLPENPRVRFDRNGFLVNVALPIDLKLPDLEIMKKFFCRDRKDVPLPAIVDTSQLDIPAENHVGIGITTNIFEYIMTKYINRGFFCFIVPNPLDVLKKDDEDKKPLLAIMPSAAPDVQYMGNNKVRLEFPYHIEYSYIEGFFPLRWKTVSEDAHIRFDYQFRPHIGGTGIHFAYLGFSHSFTNPGIRDHIPQFGDFLKEHRPVELAIPSYINPLNNLGLQTSLCRPQSMDLRNGNIMMDFRLEGMVLDYSGAKNHREWVWVDHKNLQQLAPPDIDPIGVTVDTDALDRVYNLVFSQQRLVQYGLLTNHPDGPPNYLLDGKVTVVNSEVYPPLMESMVGQKVAIEGEWSSVSVRHSDRDFTFLEALALSLGKLPDRDTVKRARLFYARNIVNGHFYHEPGSLLPKANFAAQMLGNYRDTIGVYAVNIAGDALPEILQVVRNDQGAIELQWHLRNSFDAVDTYGDGVVTTPLPEQFRDINAVWDLEVQKDVVHLDEGDFDIVKLNGKKYKVTCEKGTVAMVPFENPEIDVVNGSFEEIGAWGSGTFFSRVANATDGLYALEAGSGPPRFPLDNASQYESYLAGRTFTNSLALPIEDHDVGGTYTLEYYVKTSPETSERASYLYKKRECVWGPAPSPLGPVPVRICRNVTHERAVTLPIEHHLGITVRLSRIGASCQPRYLTPAEQQTHLTQFTVRDIGEAEPATGEWEKRQVTFSVPWNEYCGMDIKVEVKTDRIISLDGFSLYREVTP